MTETGNTAGKESGTNRVRRVLFMARSVVAHLVPRQVRRAYHKIAYAGTARHCPLCEREYGLFLPAGLKRRPDARCPGCGSLERHRSVWTYLTQLTPLLQRPARLLHVAPERCIEQRMRARANIDYLSADMHDKRAMVQMDITRIEYPDDSFDLIYCSHVLEHVPDDALAMRELRRVLRADGTAIFQVPIADRDSTYEDWSVVTPKERLRVFGQHDHVRIYGRDFLNRLADAGFSVELVDLRALMPPAEVQRLGLGTDVHLYVCGKGTTPSAAVAQQASNG